MMIVLLILLLMNVGAHPAVLQVPANQSRLQIISHYYRLEMHFDIRLLVDHKMLLDCCYSISTSSTIYNIITAGIDW